MPGWRLLAAVIALAGYGWLSHWLMTNAPAQPWTVAALFGPLLAAIAFTGFKRRHWPTLALAAVCAAVVVVVVARGGVADVRRLYVLQHGAINAVLCWTFAMTLRPGSTALITMLGERVHTHFTPAMRDYTRWLTGVWALYFVAMIVVSVLLYTLAPWPWWSFFCNALTPLAAVAMFAVEHLMRYRRHPEFERISIARAVRAYQSHSAEAR
jgi:uncharacterized membrane protein